MRGFVTRFKRVWFYMLNPPWRNIFPADAPPKARTMMRAMHWYMWILGWAWALAGVGLGALVAPTLVEFAGLSNYPHQDWLTIGIAVLAGIVVQLLGMALLTPFRPWISPILDRLEKSISTISGIRGLLILSLIVILGVGTLILTALPFAGVGYGIYRYLTWVGPGQRSVTIAFVGGLLVKTFAIPLIKGIITGALFRWFMHWLRGDKDTRSV